MIRGMGASKVRNLFDKARSVGKAIIFIDEIDTVGKRRK
jgi:cell division protease FtsH